MAIAYEDKMLILGLYHSGEKMISICEKAHCSDGTVRKVLKEFGLKAPRSYTKITPEIRDEAKALHESGMPYRSIAIKLGVGFSTVKHICAEDKKPIFDNAQLETQKEEQQMELPISQGDDLSLIAALRMIRDALDMIIETEGK